MTPSARSLELLRNMGWPAESVEKWIPRVNIRKDLFGWIDIVAICPEAGAIYGIQTTSADNHAARMHKARGNTALTAWLGCGGRLEVWSWGLKGGRDRRKVYEVRRQPITIEDLRGDAPNGSGMGSDAAQDRTGEGSG